jgi:integrase
MKLTDVTIRNAKPRETPFKIYDGRGLFLLIKPNGSKLWRLRYRYHRREKLLALGSYPDTTLARARDDADDARRQVREGIDPTAARRAEREAREEDFRSVASEWLSGRDWCASHRVRQTSRLELLVFPWLGNRALRDILPPDVLRVLRRIESRGHIETAHRVGSIIGQIYRFAVASGRADRDPTADLRGAIRPTPTRRLAAITDPKAVGELLRRVWEYPGTFQVRCALQLLAYTFTRPGELRRAEWTEIALDLAEWRIPASRMKRRVEHLVPLCRQTIAILKDLRRLTGRGRYLFPGLRGPSRPISENTLTAALRTMGFEKSAMSAHGFRSIASTHLNEMGYPADAIERQLAHSPADPVRAAYHRSEHLETRRAMLAGWADYLDGLRASASSSEVVTPIARFSKRRPG